MVSFTKNGNTDESESEFSSIRLVSRRREGRGVEGGPVGRWRTSRTGKGLRIQALSHLLLDDTISIVFLEEKFGPID